MSPAHKENMTKTYTLTITEEQAKVIEHSTELLSRIMGGQWREVLDWLPLQKEIDWEEYHNDVNIMTAILSKHMIDGIDGWSSSFGVGSSKVHRYHDIAWDLHQVVRHKLSWEGAVERGVIENEDSPRNWTEMMTVNCDTPIKFGPEPLAKMERIDSGPDNQKIADAMQECIELWDEK